VQGAWRVDFKAYDRLLSLPRSGWAWEFKRRDPALIRAHRRARAVRARAARRADGSVIYRLNQRCHTAESFGLHFIPDPALSAFEAAPFWLPETMSASFDAAIDAETSGRNGARRLRWADLPGEKYFLVAPGRRDKLVIRASGYAAQLALEGDAAPVPQSAFFSLRFGADHLTAESLRHLEEFGRVCRGLSARRSAPRGASPDKLREALIALDGELRGVPRRKIAEAIFGADAVKRGWDDGDETCKKRTKRLVEKGLMLMESGYRELL
jgi:hypothetical protein